MDTNKIVEYSYVQTSSNEHFDVAVKELKRLMATAIAKGYVPQGGIAYQCVLVNETLLHILIQAVVKYEAINGA